MISSLSTAEFGIILSEHHLIPKKRLIKFHFPQNFSQISIVKFYHQPPKTQKISSNLSYIEKKMKPHLPRYKYQSALSIPRRSSTTSSHTQHHQTSSRPFWNGTAPSSSKQPNQRLQMGEPPTAGCGGCGGEVAGEGGKRGYGVAWIADGNVCRNNRGEGEQDFLLPRTIVTCPM